MKEKGSILKDSKRRPDTEWRDTYICSPIWRLVGVGSQGGSSESPRLLGQRLTNRIRRQDPGTQISDWLHRNRKTQNHMPALLPPVCMEKFPTLWVSCIKSIFLSSNLIILLSPIPFFSHNLHIPSLPLLPCFCLIPLKFVVFFLWL